jgi:starvation-inducible DNA-binding protein
VIKAIGKRTSIHRFHQLRRRKGAAYGRQHSFNQEPHVKIDIGISEANRTKVAEGLSHLLADSYTLYLKTHKFHWNVTGPMFQTLHLMFETQYTELATAVDLVAERIRALGFFAPGSYVEFVKLSSIRESEGVPKAEEMIRELVEGQEAVVRTARSIFPTAEEANDEATADLLTQRIQLHEKTAWMLRSLLDS